MINHLPYKNINYNYPINFLINEKSYFKNFSKDEIKFWLKQNKKNQKYNFFLLIDEIIRDRFDFEQCFDILVKLYPYAKNSIDYYIDIKPYYSIDNKHHYHDFLKFFIAEKEKREILKSMDNDNKPINQPRKTFKI